MRLGAALLCLLAPCLLAASCAAPPSRGGGIVSLNPCADAILVELVPANRIAAISHYSKEPDASSIPPDVAARFAGTAGTAEEVIALRPDLVVASSFTAPSTREALAQAHVNTLYLDSPTTIAASTAQVREIAARVGAAPAGEAMVRRIETAVAAARSSASPVPALLWIGGSLVTGDGTLLDDTMTTAGFSNQAAHYGLQRTGFISAEQIVADPPRVMLVNDTPGRHVSSRAAAIRAAALTQSKAKVLQAHFPANLVNCGGPVIARAVARLAQIRHEVTP